jgi:hypothetical protein
MELECKRRRVEMTLLRGSKSTWHSRLWTGGELGAREARKQGLVRSGWITIKGKEGQQTEYDWTVPDRGRKSKPQAGWWKVITEAL